MSKRHRVPLTPDERLGLEQLLASGQRTNHRFRSAPIRLASTRQASDERKYPGRRSAARNKGEGAAVRWTPAGRLGLRHGDQGISEPVGTLGHGVEPPPDEGTRMAPSPALN